MRRVRASRWRGLALMVTAVAAVGLLGSAQAGASSADISYAANICNTPSSGACTGGGATAAEGATATLTFTITNTSADPLPSPVVFTAPDAGWSVVGVSKAVAVGPDGSKMPWRMAASTNDAGLAIVTSEGTDSNNDQDDELPAGWSASAAVTVSLGCGAGGSWTTSPAASSGDTSVTVAPGPLAGFSFASVGNQTAGQQFPVSVTAVDSCGNAKTDYAGGATLAGNLDDAPDGTAAQVPSSLSWAGGVGSADVTAFDAETGRMLTATDGAVTGASDSFDVVPGAPARLAFTGQPTPDSLQTNAPFDAQVTIYDSWSNVATNAPDHVTLTLVPPSDPTLGGTGATLGQGTSAQSLGVASFTGLTVDSSGSEYTLQAAYDALGATSDTFDVYDQLVTCSGSCDGSAGNDSTDLDVTVPQGAGSTGQLGVGLSATGVPMTCTLTNGSTITSNTIGAVFDVNPPPGHTTADISVTLSISKAFRPPGVAQITVCKNDGPGTPYHQVPKCPKHSTSTHACIVSQTAINGPGADVVVKMLITSEDPFGGGV